jgi:hypothetical protein
MFWKSSENVFIPDGAKREESFCWVSNQWPANRLTNVQCVCLSSQSLRCLHSFVVLSVLLKTRCDYDTKIGSESRNLHDSVGGLNIGRRLICVSSVVVCTAPSPQSLRLNFVFPESDPSLRRMLPLDSKGFYDGV